MRSVVVFALLLLTVFGSETAYADAKAEYAIYCTACHGAEGKGDGVAGAALPMKPADFSDAKFWEGKTDAAIKKIIKDGGAASGKSPLMAPWGAVLNDAQLDAMVIYLKTFKK
jgi:mono/diheme cytochrome c family protein